MSKPFLILGTGTGVGKTLLTAGLCYQYTQAGYLVEACKPLYTGFSADDMASDPAVLLQSLGRDITPEAIHGITPWRYAAAQSPHLAARLEGDAPPLSDVTLFCQRMASRPADFSFVETAGGVMTPLNDTHTFLDLAEALQWPVLLVSGTYLGSLSHTLTALSALQSRGITLHTLVVMESAESGATLQETVETLRAFSPHSRVYPLARIWQVVEQWKHLPPLLDLC